jgi:hypothetical protein
MSCRHAPGILRGVGRNDGMDSMLVAIVGLCVLGLLIIR